MKYAWIITKVNEEFVSPKLIRLNGPRSHAMNLNKVLKTGKTFRMFDDDGIWYATGKICGDYEGFEPLDQWGTPGLGATSIKYFNSQSKKWETL